MEDVLNTLRPAWQFQLALSMDYASPSSLVTNNSNSSRSRLLLSGKNFAARNAWEKVPAVSAKQVLNLSFSPILSKKSLGNGLLLVCRRHPLSCRLVGFWTPFPVVFLTCTGIAPLRPETPDWVENVVLKPIPLAHVAQDSGQSLGCSKIREHKGKGACG